MSASNVVGFRFGSNHSEEIFIKEAPTILYLASMTKTARTRLDARSPTGSILSNVLNFLD